MNLLRDVHRWSQGHQTILGLIACLIALSIAATYAFVTPAYAATRPGFIQSIVTYTHPLSWLLLAIAALGVALRASKQFVSVMAYAALTVYGMFLITTILIIGEFI